MRTGSTTQDTPAHRRSRPSVADTPRAVTLIELVVVVSIVALLTAVLGTTLVKVRSASRNFMCKNKLKTVAFEFLPFADPSFGHVNRGESEALSSGFEIDDFQESLYKIDEFWDAGDQVQAGFDSAQQPLICAAASQVLKRSQGLPCKDAIGPKKNVSIGFNMRLSRGADFIEGRERLGYVRLSKRILDHPMVPLVFDVDGQVADEKNQNPHYSAPAAGDQGQYYGEELFWYPSYRHGGRVNAGFVGGHVLSSKTPESAPGWDWRYQPPVR